MKGLSNFWSKPDDQTTIHSPKHLAGANNNLPHMANHKGIHQMALRLSPYRITDEELAERKIYRDAANEIITLIQHRGIQPDEWEILKCEIAHQIEESSTQVWS